MAVFVALYHPNDSLQVNMTMSDGAARGNWVVEDTSSATLDFDHGEFFQTIYDGNPVGDRKLRGPDNEPLLVLTNFLNNVATGSVTFDIADGPGSFGTGDANWTRLEGRANPNRGFKKMPTGRL